MSVRFALILWLLMLGGATASATAQTASAVVRATVRPGKCPAHTRCGDNPGKGPRPTSIVSDEIPVLALSIDTAAGTRRPRLTIRPLRDLQEMGLAVSWTTGEVQQRGLQSVTRSSIGLPLQLSSATMQAPESGLITVIVEY